jgi:2-(1,2-epoxy-1,2-dihydrophenyl)acetyl-CoA isomerase
LPNSVNELERYLKLECQQALAAETDALARHFASAPTLGLARTKQALQASGLNTLEQQLDLERVCMRELGRSADYREGVAAFMDKRAPRFVGA